jgi:hypothetical protein
VNITCSPWLTSDKSTYFPLTICFLAAGFFIAIPFPAGALAPAAERAGDCMFLPVEAAFRAGDFDFDT